MEANAGLGSPVAIFQPLTSFYLALPLQFLRDYDPHGYGRLMMVNSALIFLGGLAMYRWLMEHMDHTRAQAGAILYIFWGGMGRLADGHSAAFCVFLIVPVFMWVARRIADNPSYYLPHYAFVQALLILSHLPSTVIFSAIPGLYALINAPSGKRMHLMLALTLAVLVALMLSAIYWLPLTGNESFIRSHLYTNWFHSPEMHFPRFLKHVSLPDTFYWPGIVSVMASLIIFASMLWIVKSEKPLSPDKSPVIFFCAMYLVAMFMIFSSSRWLWENFELLKKLQFSIRFGLVTHLCLIFLLSYWYHKLKGHSFCYPLVIFLTVAGLIFHANYRYDDTHQDYWQRVEQYKLVPHKSHMTHAMRRAGIVQPLDPPAHFLNVPESEILEGEAEVILMIQGVNEIFIDVEVTSPQAEIALKRYHYPGWKIISPTLPRIDVIERGALLTLRAPQGTHDIEMVQHIPKVREANLISWAGLGLLIMIAGFVRRYKLAVS
ncbi:MAG: 6-pyruvoyl-tetrahydropterin synthase-related protein [Alphaproteobacteria bacterium]|nr:6-pyruvoyl-tetrahydropterin synthase-related protein [Alphaproteobacteria bacterium]